MPKILDDYVKAIMRDNKKMQKSQAYAIATASLERQGKLPKGAQKVTSKGKRK